VLTDKRSIVKRLIRRLCSTGSGISFERYADLQGVKSSSRSQKERDASVRGSRLAFLQFHL
jgi:hypothetical protein